MRLLTALLFVVSLFGVLAFLLFAFSCELNTPNQWIGIIGVAAYVAIAALAFRWTKEKL